MRRHSTVSGSSPTHGCRTPRTCSVTPRLPTCRRSSTSTRGNASGSRRGRRSLASVAAAAAALRRRGHGRRPGGGVAAERVRDDGARTRGLGGRGDVHVDVARLRRRRRGRPVRPGRPGRARGHRPLPIRRQGVRRGRPRGRGGEPAAVAAPGRDRPCPTTAPTRAWTTDPGVTSWEQWLAPHLGVVGASGSPRTSAPNRGTSGCRSTIRCSCCTRRAPPGRRSASCTAPAGCC
jgi:hypothetical protein